MPSGGSPLDEMAEIPLQDTYEYHFFISYSSADAAWAEWVARQLVNAGYQVLFMGWDFPAGTNFVHNMDRGAVLAERTLAILSPRYLRSPYAQAECKAAYALDPLGNRRLLIPVQIEACDFRELGLLRPVAVIDLAGLGEAAARGMLLAEVEKARVPRLSGGRGPALEPAFPGLAAGRARPAAHPGLLPPGRPAQAALVDTLRALLLERYRVSPDEFTAAASLAGLGVPAAEVIELVLELETRLGADLPAGLLTAAQLATVDDVIRLFR